VSWEASRRGIEIDAADLAGGMGPLAVASAREVNRHGILAQVASAGHGIQASADDDGSAPGQLLRSASDHLRCLDRDRHARDMQSCGRQPAPEQVAEAARPGRRPANRRASLGLTRHPPAIPAPTSAEMQRRNRSPSPAVGTAFTAACTSLILMSSQRQPAAHRDQVTVAQPPLGIGVLARPRPPGRMPGRRYVVGDQFSPGRSGPGASAAAAAGHSVAAAPGPARRRGRA
jgi:hypothetical protein